MVKFIATRVAWSVLVLFMVSWVTFLLMHVAPGGPFSTDMLTSPTVVAELDRHYGLHLPVYQQYLKWLGSLFHGELGPSYQYQGTSVNQILARTLPYTLQLGAMAFGVAVVLGLSLGIVGALFHNRPPDYAATSVTIVGVVTPTFVLGILLILVFGVWLRVVPTEGVSGASGWILPTLTLAAYPAAEIARYTRASLLEVVHADYIRTARSKGLRERVIIRHMLRNALIPVVTVMGPVLATLFTGSFIVETVFSVPGIGQEYILAIGQRDYGVIMGTTMLYAAAIVAFNLLVDVAYAYINPRIRY